MKNKILFSALAVMILAAPAVTRADTANVPSTATFVAGVVINKTQDMDFGNVDYNGTPTTGDHVDIGTDGSLNSGGNFSAAGSSGTAGAVQVTSGTNAQDIDVFCDTSAHLTDSSGAKSIDAEAVKVAPQNATGSYASAGSLCSGFSTPATTFTLDIGTLDTVKLGASLTGSSVSGGFTGGAYSTGNPGGQDLRVDMFYH